MAEKTEKATPKKLRDARKKGQIAKSQDFPAAFTFVVSISSVLMLAAYLFANLAGYMQYIFRLIPNTGSPNFRVGSVIPVAALTIAKSSLPILGLAVFTGVLINFLIIGPLFSFEIMKPDLKRLNPITNLKNLFKLKTFIELIKSIFKITGAIIIIFFVIKDSLGEIVATASLPLLASAMIFSQFLLKVVIRVGIFFLFIAALDLLYQRKNFAKEMMMEKFEFKQEMKDLEGDPMLRGRRRQIAHEIAYQDGPRVARNAKTIITNPTHIAVAIHYEKTEVAPKILVMGQGNIAQKIIEVAIANHVPIMRNPPLAQKLYREGEIDQFIPEDTYEAVAEILRWIDKLEQTTFNTEAFL